MVTHAKTRRPGGRRATRHALLENCVDTLHALGFQLYESQGQFDAASVRPTRYVIRNYPHPSLYGTPGRKEAFIATETEDFILEAKWQDASGSVDEKLPYIWEAFLASRVPNWIAVFDGRYWREDARARKGIAWLKAQPARWAGAATEGDDRAFLVFYRPEFIKWATSQWRFDVSDGTQHRREAYYERRDAAHAREADQSILW